MGQAVTHIKAFNRAQKGTAVITMTMDDPPRGQNRFIAKAIRSGCEESLDIRRELQVGSVKSQAYVVYEDGSIVTFSFGIEDEESSDQVMLREADVLYNTRSRGRAFTDDDWKEKRGQRDTLDANCTINFTNGTPWKATVTVCLKGQETQPIAVALDPSERVDIDTFGRLREIDNPASFLIAYDNGTQLLLYATIHKPIPGQGGWYDEALMLPHCLFYNDQVKGFKPLGHLQASSLPPPAEVTTGETYRPPAFNPNAEK